MIYKGVAEAAATEHLAGAQAAPLRRERRAPGLAPFSSAQELPRVSSKRGRSYRRHTLLGAFRVPARCGDEDPFLMPLLALLPVLGAFLINDPFAPSPTESEHELLADPYISAGPQRHFRSQAQAEKERRKHALGCRPGGRLTPTAGQVICDGKRTD